MRSARVLFCLRERGNPYHHNPKPDTSDWANKGFTGLSNSVRYVTDMLNAIGVEASFVVLADNNKIDAAVKAFNATHAIIEALWVVPSKLPVLIKANPTVKWNLRLHSEIPFMSTEGVAIKWIYEYLALANVSVSANSTRLQGDLATMTDRVIPYTPNYYPLVPLVARGGVPADNVIDVGCFGAIRPLKNQLTQALAAIQFANNLDRPMRFHINGDRIEGGALPIYHNLVALFANNPKHDLVQHGWLDTAAFIALCKTMDIGMQVSFTETFNLVSADLVIANVPIVVSDEVVWAAPAFKADPTSVSDIVAKMEVAWASRSTNLHHKNYNGLVNYDRASEIAWPHALAQM